MKRAFKIIGIFLSAILLLAGCSSDDEDMAVSLFPVKMNIMEEIGGTTNVQNIHYTWRMMGAGQDDSYDVIERPPFQYKITLFNNGTFEGYTDNNTFRGKYICNEDGSFKFTEYNGVDLTTEEDELLIHTNIKNSKRFGVGEDSQYLVFFYTDKDFCLFYNIETPEE
jgi:hypothetical protein